MSPAHGESVLTTSNLRFTAWALSLLKLGCEDYVQACLSHTDILGFYPTNSRGKFQIENSISHKFAKISILVITTRDSKFLPRKVEQGLIEIYRSVILKECEFYMENK